MKTKDKKRSAYAGTDGGVFKNKNCKLLSSKQLAELLACNRRCN